MTGGKRDEARGFTLIEALIAMAVVAILAGVAVPAWSGAREAAHALAAKASLGGSILAAITHSSTTGVEVVLCPGTPAGCRGGMDWSHGWIAYADLDRDRVRDAHETLVKSAPALGARVHLRSTVGRTRLVFQPNGGNAGSNVTFTLCDGRGARRAVTLVLANDGRLRAGTPTPAAAQACMATM